MLAPLQLVLFGSISYPFRPCLLFYPQWHSDFIVSIVSRTYALKKEPHQATTRLGRLTQMDVECPFLWASPKTEVTS
jgi:hypothetical protein